MITILGASGFIGSHLARRLAALDVDHQAIGRADLVPRTPLGDVVYCIGLTADFRSRRLETVDAHVCTLLQILRDVQFDSLLYLSSTRVYAGAASTHEAAPLLVSPQQADDLYNISKALGEAMVLNCGRRTRVARISNVYGRSASDTFLGRILKQAARGHRIVFETALDSERDFISIDDVVDGLVDIATGGRERIYNLASGVNVAQAELADGLRALTGCAIEVAPSAPTVRFPPIDISRMQREFAFAPGRLPDELARLITAYAGQDDHH